MLSILCYFGVNECESNVATMSFKVVQSTKWLSACLWEQIGRVGSLQPLTNCERKTLNDTAKVTKCISEGEEEKEGDVDEVYKRTIQTGTKKAAATRTHRVGSVWQLTRTASHRFMLITLANTTHFRASGWLTNRGG